MLIKPKSLIVAVASSLIVAMVLVLTLVGYVMYIELSAEKAKISYQDSLDRVNAKVYAKHIEFVRLDAKWERAGALRGNPIIEGMIKNTGTRNVTNILIKVSFIDSDGAILYEVVFHPNEPALGTYSMPNVAIPYRSGPSKILINQGGSLTFKKILTSCPREIALELEKGTGFGKGAGRWSGKLLSEILAIDL